MGYTYPIGTDPSTWAVWLQGLGFHPVGFFTLTFDDRRGGVTPEAALWFWRHLVRLFNEDVGGTNYRRKWGHSWFSYVVGVEYHKTGVPHLHALVDGRLDFKTLHRRWNSLCGFAWTRIVGEEDIACRYVLKYVAKGEGLRSIWLQPRKRENCPSLLGRGSEGQGRPV